jgi:predicted nuclease with TOPRIM domain
MNQMSLGPFAMPPHLRQAQLALDAAGIPLEAGLRALALANEFYHQTPQVSQTDSLRRERNQLQDEMESLSSQLQLQRATNRQLAEQLASARQLPKEHQQKAYRLRKQLRAMLQVLEHPQAREMTKLTRVEHLIKAALADSGIEPDADQMPAEPQ